ncbi:MAG: response regulator transcription factor [Verrucomicrobia bacterium]|nr:response regulator transcription factor [Verrucomicrobiota bacterium]
MKKRALPAPDPAAAVPRRRILLVDDHPFMRAGLRQLIDRQPDMAVWAEAGNPAEAFRHLAGEQPDLVLTDLTMPGRSGLEFIKDLRAAHPDVAVLVISMHDEGVYAERVLRAGARGYIMKEAGGENLLAAIRQVLRGEVSVSQRMSARILDALSSGRPRGSHSPIERLTDREFEVFQLIGQGKSTRDIAVQLHLSPKTVDVHRSHLKEKLGLRDTTALIRHAVRWVETQQLDP